MAFPPKQIPPSFPPTNAYLFFPFSYQYNDDFAELTLSISNKTWVFVVCNLQEALLSSPALEQVEM